MTLQVVQRLFAMLSLLGGVGAVGGAVLFLPGMKKARAKVLDGLGPLLPTLVIVVSAGAMAGSLYFSEVAGFVPCHLCYLQRWFMYPLVALASVAAFIKKQWLYLFITFQAIVGAGVSTYHVLIQRLDTLTSSSCDPSAPCSLRWVNEFGFISIPTMALFCFLLIAVASLLIRKREATS
jgi:disulfide bond formation protein DsbB